MRVVNADLSVLKYMVSLELEEIPLYTCREDVAVKILVPACWILFINPTIVDKTDLSKFRLTAWTKDPGAIPSSIRLFVAESEAPKSLHSAALQAASAPYRYTCKK